MVATRCGDQTCLWNVFAEKRVKGTTGLKAPCVLHLFEFQLNRVGEVEAL